MVSYTNAPLIYYFAYFAYFAWEKTWLDCVFVINDFLACAVVLPLCYFVYVRFPLLVTWLLL